MRVLAGLTVSLILVVSQVLSATPAVAHDGQPNVTVVNLRVDNRPDEPLGIDDANPLLAWQMTETRRAAAHPCYRHGARLACPADNQTAYQIQAATSE